MTTYIFAEKNGNATLTLNADNEEDAMKYFEGIVKYPMSWRMEIVDESSDEE
jgi:hypothetical protein